MLWSDQNTLNMSRFYTANGTLRLFRLHRFSLEVWPQADQGHRKLGRDESRRSS